MTDHPCPDARILPPVRRVIEAHRLWLEPDPSGGARLMLLAQPHRFAVPTFDTLLLVGDELVVVTFQQLAVMGRRPLSAASQWRPAHAEDLVSPAPWLLLRGPFSDGGGNAR